MLVLLSGFTPRTAEKTPHAKLWGAKNNEERIESFELGVLRGCPTFRQLLAVATAFELTGTASNDS